MKINVHLDRSNSYRFLIGNNIKMKILSMSFSAHADCKGKLIIMN